MVGHVEYNYQDQTAIVTGSTSGIGYGIAKAFATADANVVINSRTASDVAETASELDAVGDGTVIGIEADLCDVTKIDSLVSKTLDKFDTIDILINNAAVWPQEESIVTSSLNDWEYTFDVNVRSQYYLSKIVSEHMISRNVNGAIVNITSQTGDRRAGDRGLYGISKTAINGLTWKMAHELAQEGIRMNAISTDVTDSRQLRLEASQVAENDPDKTTGDVLERWGNERPLGRLGQPADIADAVLYLCSDAASYVVGTILRVSGGGNLQ